MRADLGDHVLSDILFTMKTTYIYIALIVVVVAGLVFVRNYSDGGREARVTQYDTFAQCLTDAGAKFYGAFWCPHCAEQKAKFGNSSKLPYVECSTPNGQAQTEICIQEGITSYPTWRFPDGTELSGVQELNALGEKTSCTVTAT